jgi:DNA-binding NarL/FixJ family response regulator
VNAQPRPLRVLIADDHVPTRDDVRRALEADGRLVVCAAVGDAAAAVHAAVRERPDICLLDIRMPGRGLAAAWEIAGRLPQAKLVMLTVSEEDADLFEALRAGAVGYLPKTMNLQRLPDALLGVCSGEAAIPRTLVARVLEAFRSREPRWRRLVMASGPQQRLTSREWEVLELLAEGSTTAQIASKLTLSASAVRVHIASIVHKLEVTDRTAAVRLFHGASGAGRSET